MKRYLKKFAAILLVLYLAQAMVGIYYGIKLGIYISDNMHGN